MDIIGNIRKIFNKDSNTCKKATDAGMPSPAQQENPTQNDAQQKPKMQVRKSVHDPELQELIEQASDAFTNGKISQCLDCWELIRQRFPSQSLGYIQGGFTALQLNNLALAENLATQAIEKFPREFQAFRLSAEVAMRSCAFDLALERWALVREYFPVQAGGYIRAIDAALELKKLSLAEKLLAQAEKNFPKNSNIQKLRTKFDEAVKLAASPRKGLAISDIFDIAEKDLQMGLFKHAFMHFKVAMKHAPENMRSFSGAADAAKKLRDFPRVEKIAGMMISRFPLSITGYQYLIQSLEAREEWAKALTILEDIKKKFPQNPYGWQKYAEIQLKTGNYARADAEMEEAVKRFPKHIDILLYFAQLPLSAADPQIQRSALDRCRMICRQSPSRYNVYLQTLNICYKYISLYSSDKSREVYSYIFKNFLQHCSKKKLTKNIQTKREEKIAFYGTRSGTKYFLPVLKCFSPDDIDIILHGQKDLESIANQFDIKNYNISSGYENLSNYSHVIIDGNLLCKQPEIQKSGCTFIGYPHASDALFSGRVLENLSLALFESKNQMAAPQVPPCDPLPDGYTLPAHTNYKCELGYTGPYHIGEFLERLHEDKARLKAELAEQLEMEIPQDKPLVFMLEDEISYRGQMAYAANHMAQYATVIFKAMTGATSPHMPKFSKDVYILRGPLAQNLPRSAADFVCCGYMSGSFTTTVMLGQTVLPYYSRLVASHSIARADFQVRRYDDPTLTTPGLRSAKSILFSKFYEAGKLLDLVDTKAFKNAILGTEYREWYKSALPSLQKEAYGDYQLEGAPQKTVDYIMRFIKDGTLGKDCTAVYLKKKNFG